LSLTLQVAFLKLKCAEHESTGHIHPLACVWILETGTQLAQHSDSAALSGHSKGRCCSLLAAGCYCWEVDADADAAASGCILYLVFWVLYHGSWVLDLGSWILGLGSWIFVLNIPN
jgi:hypothetical protein